jgi:hypothetical protein
VIEHLLDACHQSSLLPCPHGKEFLAVECALSTRQETRNFWQSIAAQNHFIAVENFDSCY